MAVNKIWKTSNDFGFIQRQIASSPEIHSCDIGSKSSDHICNTSNVK